MKWTKGRWTGVRGLTWECLKELRKRKGSLAGVVREGWTEMAGLKNDTHPTFLQLSACEIFRTEKLWKEEGFAGRQNVHALWPWAAHMVSLGLWNKFDNWDKIVFCSAWSWELIMYMKAANNVCMYMCMHVCVHITFHFIIYQVLLVGRLCSQHFSSIN